MAVAGMSRSVYGAAVRSTRAFPALLLALSLAFSLLLVPGLANAYTITKTDGDDTKGPLDLAAVQLDRETPDEVRFTFRTQRKFSPFDLGQRSYFGIAFDTDLDGVAERCAFIYRPVRPLEGLYTNCRSRAFGSLPVERTGPKSVAISVGLLQFTRSLRWRAFSFNERDEACYRRGCFDSVPNRRAVFFDLEPPTTRWVTTLGARNNSAEISSTTSIPLEFELNDSDASTVHYTIERSLGSGWGEIATGAGSGPVTYVLDAQQGQSYALRLLAMDPSGNPSEGAPRLTVNVPYDDSHEGADYGSGWTQLDEDGYFLGGFHRAAQPGDIMTFTFTGRVISLLGGPGNGTAELREVGLPGEGGGWLATESASTQPGEYVGGLTWGPVATRTVSVEVMSGTFVIDGFGIEP
jgi:hypothetical protein